MTWLYTFEKFDATDDSFSACLCGRVALFSITAAPDAPTYKFCGPCMAAFMLQALKNEGVDLEVIRADFRG